MQLLRSWVVVNQKGGVGKTTCCINIAACAALDGMKVLLVDSDPQGNATSGVGIDRRNLERCIYDIFLDDEWEGLPIADRLAEVVVPSAIENLWILPSTINLAAADITLAAAIARETKLRQALERADSQYDAIIIDTAPSLGLMTINSLAAAQCVLIPMQCEYYALEGLSQLLEVVQLVQGQIHPGLRVGGLILTMYDSRTRLSEEVVQEVRSKFRGRVFDTIIPRNVRLAEAPSHGLPAVLYQPSSRGAKKYWDLYREVFADA